MSSGYPLNFGFEYQIQTLVCYSLGNNATQLSQLSFDERKKAVLDHLVKLYGKEAGQPIDFMEKDWKTEPWIKGAYFGILKPVDSIEWENLAKPEGKIFWAGTETAREWTGYMEGALESATRATQEIIQFLQLPK